jgi:hypothetical protein
VQAATVFLNREATIEKAGELITHRETRPMVRQDET